MSVEVDSRVPRYSENHSRRKTSSLSDAECPVRVPSQPEDILRCCRAVQVTFSCCLFSKKSHDLSGQKEVLCAFFRTFCTRSDDSVLMSELVILLLDSTRTKHPEKTIHLQIRSLSLDVLSSNVCLHDSKSQRLLRTVSRSVFFSSQMLLRSSSREQMFLMTDGRGRSPPRQATTVRVLLR